MGVATAVRNRRNLVIAAVAVLVVAVVAVLWWFQPQTLLFDESLDEALPGSDASSAPADDGVAADPAETADAPATAADGSAGELVTVASGDIRSLDHTSSGRALLVELPDGSQVLRFEDLDTDNGPDLRVYLSTAPADGPDGAFDDDFVDLGALKGNVGNQNYELPSGVEGDQYQSAVIWCRRFSVGFAVAPLA